MRKDRFYVLILQLVTMIKICRNGNCTKTIGEEINDHLITLLPPCLITKFIDIGYQMLLGYTNYYYIRIDLTRVSLHVVDYCQINNVNILLKDMDNVQQSFNIISFLIPAN